MPEFVVTQTGDAKRTALVEAKSEQDAINLIYVALREGVNWTAEETFFSDYKGSLSSMPLFKHKIKKANGLQYEGGNYYSAVVTTQDKPAKVYERLAKSPVLQECVRAVQHEDGWVEVTLYVHTAEAMYEALVEAQHLGFYTGLED